MELTYRIAIALCVINAGNFAATAFVDRHPSWGARRHDRNDHQQSVHEKTAAGDVSSRVILNFQNGEESFGDNSPPVMLYGESRETWSFNDQRIEGIQIVLKNEGDSVNAELAVYEGPYYTPQRMELYSENGQLYPFCAIIETPNGQQAIGISNNGKLTDRGQVVSPLIAGVKPDNSVGPTTDIKPDRIESGDVQTFPFPHSVSSVRILLQTEGFPMDARVELLQGDNLEVKQAVHVFSEDGMKNPLFTMMSTPGVNSIIRVQNNGSPHFPGITACVEPYMIDAIDENDTRSSTEGSRSSKASLEPAVEHVYTELVEEEPVRQQHEMHEQHGHSPYSQMYEQPGHFSFKDGYGQPRPPSENDMFGKPRYPSEAQMHDRPRYPSEAHMYDPSRSPLNTEMYDSARAMFEQDVPHQSIFNNAPPPMYEDLIYDDTYAHIYDAPMREPDYNAMNEDRRYSKRSSTIQDVAYERVRHP